MTALLQALGLGTGRPRYYMGGCFHCDRKWWAAVADGEIVASKGAGTFRALPGTVEVVHGCGKHGGWSSAWLSRVKATVKPAVRCNAACWGATGHHCECSCGGRNHGRG